MGTGGPAPTQLGERDGLHVRLLGSAQVRIDGEPLGALTSGRARSLLAFLVLHRDVAHSRQRLASLFWPDSSEAQARTNLRNVLHTLRRAHPGLDDLLHVTSTSLQCRLPSGAVVDVERFAAAADAAAAADPDDADRLIASCRAALELYTGELLEGEHDEWLLPARDALRDRHRTLLRTLATALIDDGRPGEAVAVVRDLVRADPLDESAHRLRMEAHHAAGDRAGAIRAYHECVATLERELGVAPAQATLALGESLLEGPIEVGSSLRPQSMRMQQGLVGRDGEWRVLLGAWESVQHGPPAAVMVTGEPGIGKTRLVDELRAWCVDQGATVGEGRSYATEGDLGYAVVTGWLRSPVIEAAVRALPSGERSELARLLPELGSPGPGDQADDTVRRRRLFDAIVAALTCSGRPTLLIADDAQWADQASHELIHYLLRQRVDVPLLVVLTARREELDASHPLSALRDALAVADRVVDLHLERLTPDATGALGSQLVGSALDDEAVEALFAESAGNPLFIVEAVRAGWEGGSGPVAMSPRLRAVIDGRFRTLSDVAAEVLRAAAVVGRPCSAGLLGTLSGLDNRSLARGLDELWRRGILHDVGSDSYAFSHGRLGEAAYDSLSPAVRRASHASAAEALAQLIGHDPEIGASQVAAHFEAASQVAEAVGWFQRAAVEAQRMYAYAESVRLLERALALVPRLPAGIRHERELELLSTLPLALAGVEGYGTDRLLEAHRRASRVAGDLGVELEPAFVRSMVMSALCRDRFGEAAEAAGRLLAHARATGDDGLSLESHYLLGISAFWAADLHTARHHFETVATRFSPSMRPGHHLVFGHDPQVVCLSRLANTLWFLGRDDEARTACDEGLAMAAAVGHPLSTDTALVFSCLLAVDLGDHELLRRSTTHLQEVTTGSLPHTTKLEALLGLLDVLDGRHAAGLARAAAALDRCDGTNFYPGFRATIVRVLLAAHEAAGDVAGGLESCSLALTMAGTPLWDPEAHRMRAQLLGASRGRPEDIHQALAAAEAAATAQGAVGHLRRIDATRARLGDAKRSRNAGSRTLTP